MLGCAAVNVVILGIYAFKISLKQSVDLLDHIFLKRCDRGPLEPRSDPCWGQNRMSSVCGSGYY